MSKHSGPEYTAPAEQRCEALVRGHPSWHFEWVRYDHQCPRRANQARGGHLVCYQHAAAKNVIYVNKE